MNLDNNHVSSHSDIDLSFEFFPAHETALSDFWECLQRLHSLQPKFVSVTYGAAGNNADRTENVVKDIRNRGYQVMPHLTCEGKSQEAIGELLQRYTTYGISQILALRGDPMNPVSCYRPTTNGYHSSVELIEAIAKLKQFAIYVGCYPEIHPDAISANADLHFLKLKQQAGATAAISQFFFSEDHFLRFRDRAVAAGIELKLIPGIMPLTDIRKIAGFAEECGASIPQALATQMSRCNDINAAEIGIEYTSRLCERLLTEGVDGLHFYTLNRAKPTMKICDNLGFKTSEAVISKSQVA